jgi:hypothetical protein
MMSPSVGTERSESPKLSDLPLRRSSSSTPSFSDVGTPAGSGRRSPRPLDARGSAEAAKRKTPKDLDESLGQDHEDLAAGFSSAARTRRRRCFALGAFFLATALGLFVILGVGDNAAVVVVVLLAAGLVCIAGGMAQQPAAGTLIQADGTFRAIHSSEPEVFEVRNESREWGERVLAETGDRV